MAVGNKKLLKQAIAWASLKLQNYIPVSDEIYLESYFKELKGHTLISVKRNDRQILLGKYLGSSFEDDIPVINVDERSEQIEKWKQAGYDFAVNDRLYIPQHDMLIEIYQAPDHFFGD